MDHGYRQETRHRNRRLFGNRDRLQDRPKRLRSRRRSRWPSCSAATGISKDLIDGLAVTAPLSECPNPFFAVYMTEALGVTPTWLNYGGTGGCSATGGVARAASAIRDGHCEVAIVLSADAPSTAWRANYGAYRSEFQDPPGVQGPPATFGLLMSRYHHQFGIKPEALGKDRHHPARARVA